MRLFTLVIFATCVVLGSALPPPCMTKKPPSENPMKCTHVPQSLFCLVRPCTFTAIEGLTLINQKLKSVKLAKKIRVTVDECKKPGQKCSGYRCPCRCYNKGKWIWEVGMVTVKINGNWVSVPKAVKLRVPGGCTCTEPDD
ncbi:uncharacterized protein LOC144432360 [Styela clava]